ncbi:MAG: carboxypeptidase-like regulatory domain-containing protein [Planctomycetota bacterium]|jgi:protocatechuate 3,4-dioxygenase beta subunit
MNRTASLLLAMVLAALGAAVWLLTREDSGPGETPRLTRPAEEEPAPAVLPEVDAARGETAAPEPIEVPAAAEGAPPEPGAPGPAPFRRVTGRVVRLSDGTPIPGVTIRAVDREPEESAEGPVAPGIVVQSRTSMSPAGTFVLESVPTLGVRFDLSIARPGFRRSGQQVLPAGEDEVTNLELVFDTGFAIEGFVTDDTGRVLPGAVVEAGDAQVVRADANGRFRVLDALPKGDEEAVRITASAPWHQRVNRELHAPDDHRVVPELTLELPGSGVIEGRVLRADGRPVVDTWVRVAFLMTDKHGQTAPRRLSDDTDGQGRYRIDHVPAGRYVVQAGVNAKQAAISVDDPELPRGVLRHRATTDSEGRFDIGGLTPGEKRLQIGKQGYVSIWVPVEPGAHDGRWTLLPAPVIRGRVLDARTGEPLHDFDVTIAAEFMTASYNGDTYEEGRFAYDVDDDGPYTVTIEAAGYREQSRRDVVPSMTEATPLLFRLEPGT